MPTSHLLRCSLSVVVIMSQPVNALSALAQAMGACTFVHKEWCGRVKVMTKTTEDQRSGQVQVAESFPRATLSKCYYQAITKGLNLTPDIQSYPPTLNPKAVGKFNPF